MRYFLAEIDRFSEKEDNCIFEKMGDKYEVKEEYIFHLYVSEVPCGDASILS